jgi:hypothetical protein
MTLYKKFDVGYTSDKIYADMDWLEGMAVYYPQEFQSLTGYCPPTPPQCKECGECNPQVEEIHHNNNEGCVAPHYRMVCEQWFTPVNICAMNVTDNTTIVETHEESSELILIFSFWSASRLKYCGSFHLRGS